MSKAPTCEKCGAKGHGVTFNIFGPFPFGKYCVPCEKALTQDRDAHQK